MSSNKVKKPYPKKRSSLKRSLSNSFKKVLTENEHGYHDAYQKFDKVFDEQLEREQEYIENYLRDYQNPPCDCDKIYWEQDFILCTLTEKRYKCASCNKKFTSIT